MGWPTSPRVGGGGFQWQAHNSSFTVTSSAHFVSTISCEIIIDNEIMVSFDVGSLFTNGPIDAAVQTAPQKLEDERTTPTAAQNADLQY